MPKYKSKKQPPKHDIWITEIKTKKPIPRLIRLIRKYEELEEEK